MAANNEAHSIVYPIKDALNQEHLDETHISKYIINEYLPPFGVQSFFKEENYVDKDYLIDYAKFYSRSFEKYDKFTERVHFFKGNVSEEDLTRILTRYDEELYEKIFESYLGFVVVKPVKNSRNHKIIGRTVLKTYDEAVEGHPLQKRIMIKQKNSINLFGLQLEIDALPFQTQDKSVGACATTACWISLNKLADLFETPKSSLVEITEKSISFPSENRNFPSPGLNYLQIKNFYNTLGLDTDFIDPVSLKTSRLKEIPENVVEDVIEDIIKAYIKEFNLPVLAGLKIIPKDGEPLYHAVIISGYRHENGKIIKIYIHDDQIGLYSRVTSEDHFFSWIDSWLDGSKFTSVTLDKLVVPLYPKIRLSFKSMYFVYLVQYKAKLEDKKAKNGIDATAKYELFLTDVKKYKKFLLDHQISNKIEKLKKPFPKYLWIARLESADTLYWDYVYDATAAHAIKPYENIVYNSPEP